MNHILKGLRLHDFSDARELLPVLKKIYFHDRG